MKKILMVIAISVFYTAAIKAQGNLQFNRAINNNYTVSVVGSGGGGSGTATSTFTITVPTGKVWKIETSHSSYSNNNSSTSYGSPSGSFNQTVTVDQGIISTGGSSLVGPLWLAAGTHTLVLNGSAYNSSGTYTHYLLLSGIEFNITQ